MSKTKMALDVAQNLRLLADSLEALVNAIDGDTPSDLTAANAGTVAPPVTSTPTNATPTAAPAEKPPTLVELRAFVSQRSTPDNRPKIKALLTQHGVNKLTELPEAHYAALMREVAAL